MTRRVFSVLSVSVSVAALIALAPIRVAGQAAGVARTADGKPDLSGIWQAVNTASWDIQDHHAQRGVPAGPGVVEGGEIPYQPWATAKKKENYEHRATADPDAKCYLPGVPRITYMPYPFQIVQGPGQLTLLYEYVRATRTIYTNGTNHPKGPIDWWLGDSRGHWDGDTLVVDVVHFNDQTWFDRQISQRRCTSSNAAREANINCEVTIEDPKSSHGRGR